MANWQKLVRSGSNVELNRLYVGTSVTASSGFSGSLSGTASFAVSASYSPSDRAFGITIDGGGSAITTGVKGDITVPFNGTINSWYLVADQTGNIEIDVWKDIFANYPPTVADSIAGSEKPTLLGASSNSDTNLTTWTSSVSIGDVVRFNVNSASTITRVNLIIRCRI